MAKRSRSSQPEMIHCPYCGEDYSSTYKHCPFCDEVDQTVPLGEGDEGEDARPRGGKRLAASNTRGGGYGRGPSPLSIISRVVSLGLIIAAVIIVITIIMPLVSKGDVDNPGTLPPQESETLTPDETGAPGETTPPATEEPGGETVPPEQTATSFSLDKTEFSFSNTYPYPVTVQVTYLPAGSTGSVTWTSSDPDIVSVDENGVVYHGTKTGTATITVSMPGAPDAVITVYNSATTGEGLPSAGSGGSGSTALSLNRTDFTLEAGQSFRVQVSGTTSTPAWSISDTSVATVSADGTVTYAGRGTATLTCTVDGQTLTCIVRGS